MREEINRLMDLQVIDRQLQELEQSLSSIAGRVDQLRDENQNNQAELDRLTEQDKEITAARKKAERELAEGEVTNPQQADALDAGPQRQGTAGADA